MITTTMTYQEIIDEVKKDLPNCIAFAEKKVSDKKYYREALKHDKKFFFKPVLWESKRKNQYMFLPISLSKSITKHKNICFSSYCYYFDKHQKMNAVFIGRDVNTILTSHLFDRFAERVLNDDTLGKIEVMTEFLKRNSSFYIDHFETDKYENSIFAKNKDGAALGVKMDGKLNILKTYISNNMLKGSEIELACECDKGLSFYENIIG